MAGDFNIHVDVPSDNLAKKFLDLLSNSNMKQLVNVPTHRLGHTLDLIITRDDDDTISLRQVINEHLSDHFSIQCEAQFSKPKPVRKYMVYRKTCSIDVNQFASDIESSSLHDEVTAATSLVEKCDKYQNTLVTILDKHAPMKKRSVIVRPNTSWYDDDIRSKKKEERRAEKQWRKTKLEIHRQLYKHARNCTNKALSKAKQCYIRDNIEKNKSNYKELYKLVNGLLKRQATDQLPDHNSSKELADRFADFFHQKIANIRSDLQLRTNTITDQYEEEVFDGVPLSSFPLLDDKELKSIVTNAQSKTCSLDPVPTWLLKSVLPHLAPTIREIINSSLITGVVPEDFKKALVLPLLKKPGLDLNELKNYRPVSNLSFISKCLEKVVAERLKSHLHEHNLNEQMQSAYRSNHSTETALLCVHDDVMNAMDNRKITLFVLLDLSSAFDTIDHDILFHRLESRLGITGTCLEWFKSYLRDRKQSVLISDHRSSESSLKYGVPQGSVLGPLLFTVYILPIGDIIRRHSISFHLYADDNQLYLSIDTSQLTHGMAQVERCIEDIRSWMASNFLKLNDSKTEFLTLGSRQQLEKVNNDICINIGNDHIGRTHQARNLGVIFNSSMSMENHVKSLSKSCHFHLYNIGKIRYLLDDQTTKLLTQTLVISRLDYCNSLLFNVSSKFLNYLQRIQNTAARIVTRTRRSEHITPVLMNLHWLPVELRIEYKILLLTHSCVYDSSGCSYLKDRVSLYSPVRTLRSGDKLLLSPAHVTTSMGERSFSAAAPKLWNSLPLELRSFSKNDTFKSNLKTFLFRKAYLY